MPLLLDRHWLLTSTAYGTWLPGDQRGFVSRVKTDRGNHELHNIPATPYDRDLPSLKEHHSEQLAGPPVLLTKPQAQAVLAQFQGTACYREWNLLAAAAMANHFHLVLSVPGDPDPSKLLKDLKAYASRALNEHFEKPANERWWTRSGSKRKLPNEPSLRGAIKYTWQQRGCLARSVHPDVPAEWL